MAYKGVMDDIRDCVALKTPKRAPVFAMSEEFDVRMAGMTYDQFNRDPAAMSKCLIDTIRAYGYDWAWLQVDDCIEFEVLGVGVKGGGNILPATCAYLPAAYETLRSLKMPDPQKDGRMPVLLEAIKRVKDTLGDTICVTGRLAAPFSSVTLLYGMMDTLTLIYDDPDLIQETIKFFIDLQIKFGLAQFAAGADALWVGDCNASGHLISEDQYREFALDGVKQIVKAYDEVGGLSFYHASEHYMGHLIASAETGVSAVSVGPGMDLAAAKKAVGGCMCLMGNVDPVNVLLFADAQTVYDESRRVFETGAAGGGYIFNSGEMIPRDTPEENIRAFMRAGRGEKFI